MFNLEEDMTITYENYYYKITENNIKICEILDRNYDDVKEPIVKLVIFDNFNNTSNKNKTFFQYDCEKTENTQPIPFGVMTESYRNISKITPREKTILCSSQFSNTGSRETLPTFPFVTYFPKQKNISYLENIASSKYILSPHGHFPDCFRHYEAMYLSAIPITIRHPKLYFLEDMPVLLLNSWNELTEELLISSYDSIINKSREKLDINYWISLMKDVK